MIPYSSLFFFHVHDFWAAGLKIENQLEKCPPSFHAVR